MILFSFVFLLFFYNYNLFWWKMRLENTPLAMMENEKLWRKIDNFNSFSCSFSISFIHAYPYTCNEAIFNFIELHGNWKKLRNYEFSFIFFTIFFEFPEFSKATKYKLSVSTFKRRKSSKLFKQGRKTFFPWKRRKTFSFGLGNFHDNFSFSFGCVWLCVWFLSLFLYLRSINFLKKEIEGN